MWPPWVSVRRNTLKPFYTTEIIFCQKTNDIYPMQFEMLVKCGLTSPHRATGEVFVNASLKGHFDFYDPKSFERRKYTTSHCRTC